MRPALEVADIFRRHGEAFRRRHDGRLGRVERRVMAAIETCSSAIPSVRIPISENMTANGTIIAAINPARIPKNTMTRMATTIKVCATLESAELTEALTCSA